MKTVTLEEFKGFSPCWLEDPEKAAKLEEIGSRKAEWTALDVLNLEEVSEEDRLWAVLREEFLPAELLHEFACRCAERALKAAGVTDTRCWNAIEAKRKWLKNEITDEELAAARDAARAAARAAAWAATWYAARDAAWVAARDAAWVAARAAARAAAWVAAKDAAWVAERKWQVEELKNMIKEAEECTY